jgi:regulator of replication initiation timing
LKLTGKSVESCHEKITELIETVNKQSTTLKEFEKSFEALKQENASLRTKVKSLEQQLDDADQYSRINCLEINGIPETKNEDVTEIIKTIGNTLGVTVSAEDIDACHRLGLKQEGRKRGIIVKFVRRHVKEEVLRKRKIKRNLNTSDIGMSSGPAEIVYINESLSPARRKVLNAARAFKKEQGFTFVWVKNGNIPQEGRRKQGHHTNEHGSSC